MSAEPPHAAKCRRPVRCRKAARPLKRARAALSSLASGTVTEHIRQGVIMPLGVSARTRNAALPEVPAFAETVAPGFDVDSRQGILNDQGFDGVLPDPATSGCN
jgi:hypothetical protein